jgi:hypothetical protein
MIFFFIVLIIIGIAYSLNAGLDEGPSNSVRGPILYHHYLNERDGEDGGEDL